MKRTLAAAAVILATATLATAQLPSSFDLRDVGGVNYVTSVKEQQGGTCWTHGAMAAMEGNLLMTGAWAAAGEIGEPNLAEYHLDWWNGFNQYNNDDVDPPTGTGLEVHMGGDYRVTSAYLTRAEGAVRDVDGQSYNNPPPRSAPSFHYYYPRHIAWYVAEPDLSNIDAIKTAVMDYGVMGTCMAYDGAVHRRQLHPLPAAVEHDGSQPRGGDRRLGRRAKSPRRRCRAPGSSRTAGAPGGATTGTSGSRTTTSGPASTRRWARSRSRRSSPSSTTASTATTTTAGATPEPTSAEAFNAFTAAADEQLAAVSFFTAAEDVSYTVTVYDRFEGGELGDVLSTTSGTIADEGFHTVDLDLPVALAAGNDFYIYLDLSAGGHPFDRSSEVPVLLGSEARVWVPSSADPGQSFYRSGGSWHDLYVDNDSANFCIKGLAVEFVDPSIFADSFESGDVTAWSAAIP